MAVFTLFASTLNTIEKVEALRDFNPLDNYASCVTPAVDIEAPDLWQAMNLLSDQFETEHHPVFASGNTQHFFLKEDATFRHVTWNDVDERCLEED